MSNSAKKRRKVEAGPPLSDEELRRYKFNIETPHTIEGYTFDKPDDDEFVRVIKTYEVPHRRNSRKGMVWCTYCKEHNHYIGGIAVNGGAKRGQLAA